MIENIKSVTLFGSSAHVAAAADAGSNNFPPLPPLPGYPNPNTNPPSWDPTIDPNWPQDDSSVNETLNGNNPLQALVKAASYIDAHSSDPMAYIVLARIVQRLSTVKENGTTLLSITESQLTQPEKDVITNLLKDGIDYASQWGFLYGYGGSGPGTQDSYTGFAQALLNTLGSTSSDPLIKGMIAECTYITDPVHASTFVTSHIYNGTPPNAVDINGNPIQNGDIIFQYAMPGASGTSTMTYYDWTLAQANGLDYKGDPKTTLQAIEFLIDNADGAAGGPNPNITSLDQILNQLQTQDLLNTIDELLKELGGAGAVGWVILAFMETATGYQMNSLGGSADVMDQEKRFSQLAQQIENDLKEIGPNMTPDQAQQIAANTITLFQEIMGSSQFANGLGPAVKSAMQTFESTMIGPLPGTTAPASLWQWFTGVASGTVSSTDFAAALQNALAPTAPTPAPGGGPSPGSPTDPGSTALQGILGGFDGLITAVSSNSSAEVTSSQQTESLIQAMTKVMTGVTDKTQGISTGVIATTIKNQTSS